MPAIIRRRRLGTTVNRVVHKRIFGSMDNSTVIQYQDSGKTLGKSIADTLDMPSTDTIMSRDNANPIYGA